MLNYDALLKLKFFCYTEGHRGDTDQNFPC
jgi:hypothetical protein